jgi:hypothetical protein
LNADRNRKTSKGFKAKGSERMRTSSVIALLPEAMVFFMIFQARD